MDSVVQTLVNGVALGGTYALLAIGLAMVYSVMGLINFAHGELLTITGYALVGALSLGIPFWPAALVGIAAAVVAAVAMERIAFRPLRGASLETLLLSSFAISVVLQVLFAELISTRAKPVQTPGIFSSNVTLLGVSIGSLQLVTIGVVIVLLVGLTVFLRRSMLGRSVRAAGIDFEMARLVGVRANSMFLLAFALSGALAGVAGLLWVGQRGSVDPSMGLAPVIAAFLATIIGGLGNLSGAALGGLLYGLLQTVLEQVLPGSLQPYRDAIVVSLVVAILLFRPNGVLSRGRAGLVREA
ncbi:branched-chain amino acid ABC transporter permease [Conexibacter sp. JD483]|uniref:branched-chain amino acid ABC transporter permease n=1 Tax=unclassified Conexibacter TaxID=2627773 RepID=UPI00271930FB|nr:MULTISPECIES: branched-chain amino acid ABC transporter permease [unclassified Conexibacter]MDO8186453.1 branched-chain amino acid ABC transporter permease [Conexibacter sp. CPCC 205706]MDO8200022.1 branched-chain amino acid ABC transporter permease [Conexibacter sp. CPCC 205762]MDR9370575.1 branched-chain amino acid ABC transporter permease [Conexibacter sp. JD483]